MTVSLALRNDPSISTATRARIRKLAAEQGYRPAPEISKLMHHLRTRRASRMQSTLCGLCLRRQPGLLPPRAYDYTDIIIEGVRQRAHSLGFGFDVMLIDEEGLTPRRLQRILLSRGVDGVIMLPLARPMKLAELLDWSNFAAVAATSSVLTPRMNTAIPDQYGNMLLLCRELMNRGLRRMGLVTRAEQDVRVDHRVMAVYTWHNNYGGGVATPPLVMSGTTPDPAELRSWIEQHQPQAIISDSEIDLDRLTDLLPPKIVQSITWASTNVLPEMAHYIGIDEKVAEVGAAAVESVAAMIQRGERGLPETPRTTLIAGEFFVPKAFRGRRNLNGRRG